RLAALRAGVPAGRSPLHVHRSQDPDMSQAVMTDAKSAASLRRRRPRSYWALRIGLGLLAFYVAVALVSFVWTPYDPLTPGVGDGYDAPSWAFPLGTDRLGADMLSRLMVGARYDLGIAFAAVSIALTVGTFIGVVSGDAGR